MSWEKDVVNMIKIYLGGKTMGALSITSLFKLNLFFLNNAGFTFGWFSFLLPLSSAMTNKHARTTVKFIHGIKRVNNRKTFL